MRLQGVSSDDPEKNVHYTHVRNNSRGWRPDIAFLRGNRKRHAALFQGLYTTNSVPLFYMFPADDKQSGTPVEDCRHVGFGICKMLRDLKGTQYVGTGAVVFEATREIVAGVSVEHTGIKSPVTQEPTEKSGTPHNRLWSLLGKL